MMSNNLSSSTRTRTRGSRPGAPARGPGGRRAPDTGALNEAGWLEFRFDFDCRGEARRLESGAHTVVQGEIPRAGRDLALFTGIDSAHRAVRMMPVSIVDFASAPDLGLLIGWLRLINLGARIQRFQCLLPHPRSVHPMLLWSEPLDRDLRFAQFAHQLRRAMQRAGYTYNSQDGWVLVQGEGSDDSDERLEFV